MAYQNYSMNYPQFYSNYPPTYPQQNNNQMQQLPQPQQQNNNIIWVQGEAGAKSYLVAPNNTVQLWDSESRTIYLKSADASGMPSMKILDYTIRGEDSAQNNVQINEQKNDYATHEELTALENRILDKLREVTEV